MACMKRKNIYFNLFCSSVCSVKKNFLPVTFHFSTKSAENVYIFQFNTNYIQMTAGIKVDKEVT